MEYLALENVSKSYGPKVLLDKINLVISKGDKIALIAKNGSGKSTLLQIINGKEAVEGEQAKIKLNKSIQTKWLDQEPAFELNSTISEVFYDSKHPAILAMNAYNRALELKDDSLIRKSMQAMDDLKAWDIEAKSKEILFKLKLLDLDQKISELSGGQLKRLALAKLIIEEPEFLLLDEPTNHLDIEMIEWLEKYLQSSKLTVLMVTHDRYFLERVCNQIIELDNGNLFPYKGNYSDYLEKKALRTEQGTSSHDKAKKLLQSELEWIRRQPKARGTKAKARVGQYYDLKEKVSNISFDEVFEIQLDPVRLGKKIIELNDVSKSFGDTPIIKNFWYKFKKAERIGICGPNGAGKTSFIKLLTGDLGIDSGKIIRGETLEIGHYTQDGIHLDQDKRVIEVIRDIAEYIPLQKGLKITAAQLLENFMFSREHQQVYVSQLSGGEKKRLHLLCVLMKNPNFLILDEPTNDLDILSLNVLESYLRQFPGCLIIITHDRYFMDKLVDHLFIFTGEGKIKDFNGSYSDWKERPIEEIDSVPEKIIEKLKPAESSPNDIRKLSYLEKKEMQQIEHSIPKLEERKREITASFSSGTLNGEEIAKISKELSNIDQEIDTKESRWLELSEFL